MPYLRYFAVATPLVLGWLLWAAWVTPPPQAPLISRTGLNAIADEAPALEDSPVSRPVPKAFADNSARTAHQASNKKG